MAISSCYRRRFVDRKMSFLVWSQNCLFLPIEKATVMICFSSPQLTHKNSILHYKAVKVMINASNFAEVIVDVIVCLQVITNSSAFYSF